MLRPDDLLPSDPAVQVRTLGNGLRIWARRCSRPPGSLVVQLRVGAGSLDEKDEERGAAHFVEHLAFHGTEGLPPGALQERLRELGTRIGREHNAVTGSESTTYTFSFPSAEEGLERGLFFLAEFAFRVCFPAEEVERERRVILEEMRSHELPGPQIRRRILDLLAPSSRLGRRPVIGVAETIAGLGAEQLEAFYRRTYRPDRAALVVVGDLSPERMLEAADRAFGGWSHRGPPPRRPIAVRSGGAAGTAFFLHPDLELAQVQRLSLVPRSRVETVAELHRGLAEEGLLRILGRRFAAARLRQPIPLQGARVGISRLVDGWGIVSATATGSPEQLDLLARFVGRVLSATDRDAISEQELDYARKVITTRAREARLSAPVLTSHRLARTLWGALDRSQPPPSADQRWELVLESVQRLSPGDVRAAFAAIGGTGRAWLATSPRAVEWSAPTLAELVEERAPWESARSGPSRRPRLREPLPAGELELTGLFERLGVRSYRGSNGARIHCRPMSNRPGRVWLEIGLLGGRIEETSESLGLTFAATAGFARPATDQRDAMAMRDLLRETTLKLSHRVDEDHLRLSLACATEDLELAFELVCDLLDRPRLSDAVFEGWQRHVERVDAFKGSSLEATMAEESLRLLVGGDARFRVPTAREARRLSLEQARGWLHRLVNEQPLEVAVVGDVEPTWVEELARRALAGGPARRSRGDLDGLRQLSFRPGPLSSRRLVESSMSRAGVFCGWRTIPWSDADLRRALFVGTEILHTRLMSEIRERRGLTYTVDCSYSPSRAYPDGSLLAMAFVTEPGCSDEALLAARTVVEEVADRGPSADEVSWTVESLSKRAERIQESPAYWARALSQLETRGEDLATLIRVPQLYREVDVDAVRQVLAETIRPSRRYEVLLDPTPA